MSGNQTSLGQIAKTGTLLVDNVISQSGLLTNSVPINYINSDDFTVTSINSSGDIDTIGDLSLFSGTSISGIRRYTLELTPTNDFEIYDAVNGTWRIRINASTGQTTFNPPLSASALSVTNVDSTNSSFYPLFLPSSTSGSTGNLDITSSVYYNPVSQILYLPSIKPTTIIDASSSTGSVNQVLTSTGSGISWVSPVSNTLTVTNVDSSSSNQFLTFLPTNNSGTTSSIEVTSLIYFNPVSQILYIQNIKPTTIIDSTSSTGSANQVLTSTGTSTLWVTPVAVNDGNLSISSSNHISGSGSFSANQSGNTSITISSDATSLNTPSTIVSRDAFGDFSANLITSNLSGNASSSTNLANGTVYSVPYQTSANNTSFLANSTTGSVLTTNSTTSPPSWVTQSSLTAGKATNLENGTVYSVVYQTSANNTSFLSNSTTGSVLTTNSTSSPPSWVTQSSLTAGKSDSIYIINQNVNQDRQITFVSSPHTVDGYYSIAVDSAYLTYNPNSHTLKPINISVSGTFADSAGLVGTTGQVLSSTVTGTSWVTPNATTVTIADNNTNTTFYPTFVNNNTGNLSLYVDKTTNPLSYNPSTGLLSATSYSTNSAGGSIFSSLTTTALTLVNGGTNTTTINNNQITVSQTAGSFTTTITPTSVTSTSFNGTATRAGQVATTSDNTSGTYYIPFSKTTAGTSTTLYLDDTTNALTYNPNTSSLTIDTTNVNQINPRTASSGITATTTGPNTGVANSSYPITLTNTDTNGSLTSYTSSLVINSTSYGSSGYGGAVRMSASATTFGSTSTTIMGVDYNGAKITSVGGSPYLYGYTGGALSPSTLYMGSDLSTIGIVDTVGITTQTLTVANSGGTPTILGTNTGTNSPINFPTGILYNQYGPYIGTGTQTLSASVLYGNNIFVGNASFIVKLPSTAGLSAGAWIGITFAPNVVTSRTMTIQNFSGGALTTLTNGGVANAAGSPTSTCRLMLLSGGAWYCV